MLLNQVVGATDALHDQGHENLLAIVAVRSFGDDVHQGSVVIPLLLIVM